MRSDSSETWNRLLRLAIWGVLCVVIAQTLAVRQAQLAAAAQLPHQPQERVVRQFERADTLLQTGLLYTARPARVAAVMHAGAREPGPGARGGVVQRVELGPWLRMPADSPVRVKDAGNATNYGYSVLLAAVWALSGSRTLETAGYWVYPFEALALLGCFLLGRSLARGGWIVRDACGLLAAVFFSQFGVHIQQLTWLRWHVFSTYVVLAVACTLVLAPGRRPVVLGLLLGILIGLGNEVRGVVLLMPLAVGLAAAVRFGVRRAAVIALVCVAALTLIHGAVERRLAQQRAALGQREVDRHAFWHVMLLGLGDFPNPYGLGRLDGDAFRTVRAVAPDVVSMSAQYEAVAKGLVMRHVGRHPGWYLRLLATRMYRILSARDSAFPLQVGPPAFGLQLSAPTVRVLLCLLWPIGVGAAVLRKDRLALAALCIFAYPILMSVATTASAPTYYMAGTVGLGIFAIHGAAVVVHGLVSRWAGHGLDAKPDAAWGSRVADSLRALIDRLPADRLGTLGGGVVVVAGLVAASGAVVWTWSDAALLGYAAPWTAHEGYAAGFAAADPASLPQAPHLRTIPQGYIGLPLPVAGLRMLRRATALSPLVLARGVGLGSALTLAATAAFLVWRTTRRLGWAGVAACFLLAHPALRITAGAPPDALAAVAACVTALVLLQTPDGGRTRGIVAGVLWGIGLLLHPGAWTWWMAVLVLGYARDHRRAAMTALVVGLCVAAVAIPHAPVRRASAFALQAGTWLGGWPAAPLYLAWGTVDGVLLAALGAWALVMGAARPLPGQVRAQCAVISVGMGAIASLLAYGAPVAGWAGWLALIIVLMLRRGAAFRSPESPITIALAVLLFCCTGGAAAIAPMALLVGAGVFARLAQRSTADPLLPGALGAGIAAALSFQLAPDFAVAGVAVPAVAWAVTQSASALRKNRLVAVPCGLLLLLQGGLWLGAPRPSPSPVDPRQLERLAETFRTASGPVLTEGWYGVALPARQPAHLRADAFSAGVQHGRLNPDALVRALTDRRYAYVLQSGTHFVRMGAVRRALFTHYALQERLTVGSAHGPVTLFLMAPRGGHAERPSRP